MALNAPEKTVKLEAIHQGIGETLIDVQEPYRREINLLLRSGQIDPLGGNNSATRFVH